MSAQFALFDDLASGPEGLRSVDDFVTPAVEQQLSRQVAALPLQPFQFGAFEGKRRVASFGFRYDYQLQKLQESAPIPPWLQEIAARVEAFGGEGAAIAQVLCTEYDTGSVSAGTVTSRISAGYSACRWVRLAVCASAGRRATAGSVMRWKPDLARSMR